MIHPRPPTGWTSWEGPLRPRAFDLAKLRGGASPWDAHTIVHNPHVRMRWWIAERPMDVLARNADGDELLFLHGGTAELYCDRSEEHTSELQSLMRISYAVFCLK